MSILDVNDKCYQSIIMHPFYFCGPSICVSGTLHLQSIDCGDTAPHILRSLHFYSQVFNLYNQLTCICLRHVWQIAMMGRAAWRVRPQTWL